MTPVFERVVTNDPLLVNRLPLLVDNKRTSGVGAVVGKGDVGLVKLAVYCAALMNRKLVMLPLKYVPNPGLPLSYSTPKEIGLLPRSMFDELEKE